MLVRPLDPIFDLQALVEIEKECFQGADPWTADDYQKQFAKHGCHGWIIELGGKSVGVIVTEKRNEGWYVVSIGVLLDYRGQGYAKDLIRKLLQCHKPVSLHVRVSNKGAIALYRSLGFTESSRVDSYYNDGEDAAFMVAERPTRCLSPSRTMPTR